MLAPIGPARVAAIRPAQPGPADDPSEEGLGVEAVTEATLLPVLDQITVAADIGDAQLDLTHRSLAANAASTLSPLGPISSADPARVPTGDARGNASVTTAFDRRPASNMGDAPRGDFATPFARAMSAYATR